MMQNKIPRDAEYTKTIYLMVRDSDLVKFLSTENVLLTQAQGRTIQRSHQHPELDSRSFNNSSRAFPARSLLLPDTRLH